MKATAVYRNESGRVEIHAMTCTAWSREDFGGEEVFDADHLWGIAIEAWAHDTEREHCAVNFTDFAECLAPGYVPPSPARRRRGASRSMPFEIEAGDGEILGACMGRQLRWLREDGKEEAGRLYPDGPNYKKASNGAMIETYPHKHTRIAVTSGGKRVLEFIDMDGTGFRAVAISAIFSVRK